MKKETCPRCGRKLRLNGAEFAAHRRNCRGKAPVTERTSAPAKSGVHWISAARSAMDTEPVGWYSQWDAATTTAPLITPVVTTMESWGGNNR